MIIKNITKKGKLFQILFDNGKELMLSEDIYTDFYFYIGKEIDNSEFLEIEYKENISKYRVYCVNLLLKRDYSVKQIREKLKKKNLNENQIESVICYLKDLCLLDDDKYYRNLIFSLESKGYGYYYIVSKIDDYVYLYDENVEKEKINKILDNLVKKYSSYNFDRMKKSVHNSLVLLGYKEDIIKYVLNKIDDSFSVDDKDKLKRDFFKTTYKFSKSEILMRKDKIIRKLIMHGYSYNDIIDVINGELLE